MRCPLGDGRGSSEGRADGFALSSTSCHPIAERLLQDWFDEDDANLKRNDLALRTSVSERRGFSPLQPRGPSALDPAAPGPLTPGGLASQPTLSRLNAVLATEVNLGVLRDGLFTLCPLRSPSRALAHSWPERDWRASSKTRTCVAGSSPAITGRSWLHISSRSAQSTAGRSTPHWQNAEHLLIRQALHHLPDGNITLASLVELTIEHGLGLTAEFGEPAPVDVVLPGMLGRQQRSNCRCPALSCPGRFLC